MGLSSIQPIIHTVNIDVNIDGAVLNFLGENNRHGLK